MTSGSCDVAQACDRHSTRRGGAVDPAAAADDAAAAVVVVVVRLKQSMVTLLRAIAVS